MAQRNFLVEGLSGTGKSSVYEELIRRGYTAITTDRAWSYSADPDTGLPGGPTGHDTWMWDRQKALGELESPEPDVLFVCGSSRNRDDFLPYFTKVFNLRIDDDTMRRRLEARTEDDWPLGQAGVELMVELNRSDEGPAGATDIDATQPLDEVVDDILRQAGVPRADPDVEYVGLMAEAWDALRGDTSDWPDRHFFLDLIRERGEPVLDVGCGTGRLLLDFLGQGIDVDGVDNSEPMLALCRRKAKRIGLTPSVYLQSMAELDLPRRYRTIIVPSSSFQLLLDRDEAGRALDAFHRHLEPGGTLAMPIIVLGDAYDRSWTAEAPLEDGSTVRRTAHERFDPVRRIESTDDLYEVFRDGELIRSERHVRDQATLAWTPDELRDALEAHGFVDLEFLSGFTRKRHEPSDEIFTVLARRG